MNNKDVQNEKAEQNACIEAVPKKTLTPISFKKLYKSMKRTKRWLRFSRNNHAYKNYYYQEFIRIIGYDNWQKVKPSIRNAWDCASGDFDKLLGLLRSFKNFTALEDLLRVEQEEKPDCLNSFMDAANKSLVVFSFAKDYKDKYKPTKADYEFLIKLSALLAGNELKEKENEIKNVCLDYLKETKENL